MPGSTPPSNDDIAAEAAAAKAEFCLTLGIAPSEYDGLTDAEVAAFIEHHNRTQRRLNRS